MKLASHAEREFLFRMVAPDAVYPFTAGAAEILESLLDLGLVAKTDEGYCALTRDGLEEIGIHLN